MCCVGDGEDKRRRTVVERPAEAAGQRRQSKRIELADVACIGGKDELIAKCWREATKEVDVECPAECGRAAMKKLVVLRSGGRSTKFHDKRTGIVVDGVSQLNGRRAQAGRERAGEDNMVEPADPF